MSAPAWRVDLDSWIDVHDKLGSDAPSGVVRLEEDGMDPAAWAEEVAQLRSVGRELRSTVAVSPDDEVVAYDDLVLQDARTGRSPSGARWCSPTTGGAGSGSR